MRDLHGCIPRVGGVNIAASYRPAALDRARAVRTVARCRRYSDDPCRSLGGLAPSAAAEAAARNASRSAAPPATAASTAAARTGAGPMFVRPIRAPAPAPFE